MQSLSNSSLRSPSLSPNSLLRAGLGTFPERTLDHADIGAGKGRHLNEIAKLFKQLRVDQFRSFGSEIHLYDADHYRSRPDKRIVEPEQLTKLIGHKNAALVTVIAPDSFVPHQAIQILSGIELLHPQGILFARIEDCTESKESLEILLGCGLSSVTIPLAFARTFLTTQYPNCLNLNAAWRDNPHLKTYFSECGLKIEHIEDGEERLRAFAHGLFQGLGGFRRTFELSTLSYYTGLSVKRVRDTISSWQNNYAVEPCLRRFELKPPHAVLY